MTPRISVSWHERGGPGMQTLAISAAIIALACVAASSTLDRLAQDGNLSTIASLGPSRSVMAGGTAAARAPAFNALAMTPTAAINQPIAPEPRTGKQK